MATNYERRYKETQGRSREENERLFQEREARGLPTGVLRRVLDEESEGNFKDKYYPSEETG